jgi:hypothetical protein
MNLNLTRDEFHETIMLYLIKITQDNKAILLENNEVVYTEDFDDFLRHIAKRPLGDLRTVYYREPAKTKLSFKRMNKKLKDSDTVRIII